MAGQMRGDGDDGGQRSSSQCRVLNELCLKNGINKPSFSRSTTKIHSVKIVHSVHRRRRPNLTNESQANPSMSTTMTVLRSTILLLGLADPMLADWSAQANPASPPTMTFHQAYPNNAHNQREDLTIKFTKPMDAANQLLDDLDHHIQGIISKQELSNIVKELQGSTPTTTKLQPADTLNGTGLMAKNAADGAPGFQDPSISTGTTGTPTATGEVNSLTVLVANLVELDKKLSGTFQELQTKRRYVLGAMVRQMQSTVRRIRTNVSRMQTQVASIQTVANQLPLQASIGQALQPNATATALALNAQAATKLLVQQIEENILLVSDKINDIVAHLNASLAAATLAAASGQVNPPSSSSSSLSAVSGAQGPSPALKPVNPINTLNTIIHSHGAHFQIGDLINVHKQKQKDQ